jgi:hypothetical protein
MSKLIAEEMRIDKGFLGDAVGGIESGRIDLSKCIKMAFEVQLDTGVGTTCVLNLKQHDAASGGNSASLVSSVPYYKKTDAETKFTRVDSNVAAISDLDTVAGSVIVEVYKHDLDEGYGFASIEVASPGAARIVSVSAILDSKLKPAYDQEL